MPRRKTIRTLLLAVLLIAGAVGLHAAWGRAWIAYYMSCIDEQPLLAGAGLRRIGLPSLLPLSRQVAARFDSLPIEPDDMRRFLLIEEIVRDDVEGAVALYRDPGQSPDIKWMIGTLAVSGLRPEEQWDIATHWAGLESPWTKEVLSRLEVGPGCRLRDDALLRLHSEVPAERYAAALALVYNSQCEVSLEAARLVCEVTKRPDWYEHAARRLLRDESLQDMHVFERCLLDGRDALRREVLWTLRYRAQAAEIPMLLRVVTATDGAMRRDCFSLVADIVSDEIAKGGRDLGILLQDLHRYLEDPDPDIRGQAVDVLYPGHNLDAELAARITAGLSPQELVDHRLHDLLPREQLVEAAVSLAGDSSPLGAERFRDVALWIFPPLDGQDLLRMLAAATGENREVTLRGFLRLSGAARRPAMKGLIEHCAADPRLFGELTMRALACRGIAEAIGEEGGSTAEGLLWGVVDPAGPASERLRGDRALRDAAGSLAAALGGDGGRRVLQALIQQSEGAERDHYRRLLSDSEK